MQRVKSFTNNFIKLRFLMMMMQIIKQNTDPAMS